MATDSLGQLTVDLVANTGSFEAGMTRAERAMKAATKEASYQGGQLEKLVGQIDPVTGSLNRLDKQQEQLNSHFKAGRLPIEDYRQFSKMLDAQKVSAETAGSGLAKLDRQFAANGQTLKQYQNNLRGVPAQFTDIFVSLQGGQAPMTVLIQQGGQLKDMFGGLAPATKALGGYIGGLVNPLTVAAAAAATLAIAYKQGSSEASAFTAALSTTGNFAGTSAAGLGSLAEKVSDVTGTVGAASEVLAQLAGSGKIAVGSFDMIAVAALKTQSATGQAASEIVANFVKIADDPLKAVLKLDDGMNFLTETIYSQIKAFTDAGDAQAAAALANATYAKALEESADTIKQNLGYIESAWNVVKNAAKGAWDAMAGVGRDTTLDEGIKKAQALVDTLAEAKKNALPGMPSNSIREKDAQDKLSSLLIEKQEKENRASSARIAAQQKSDALDAAVYIDKIHTDMLGKDEQRAAARKKYELEITMLRAGVIGGTVSADDPRLNAERIAKDLDGIDAKYAEKKAARTKAYTEDAGTIQLDQAKQQYAVLQQQAQQIDDQTGKTKTLGTAQQELIKWEQELSDLKNKGTLTAAQKSLLATADQITAQKTLNAELEKDTASRIESAKQAAQLAEFQQSVADNVARYQQGLDNQVAGIGLGSEGRRRLQEDLSLQQDYANQLERLRRDKIGGKITQETYDQETQILKGALEQQLQATRDNYAKMDAARADWTNGANAALQDYAFDAADIAGQTYDLVSNGLSGIEDAFVDLATNGKFSFRDLADSIIADLARIAAKTLIVQPLIAALFGGSGGGGGASGGLGALLGGSSSESSGGGLWSGVVGLGKNLYSMWNSLTGVGSSISSGFASGGFGGAVQGGVGYYSNMLAGIGGQISSGFTSLIGGNIAITGATTAGTIATQAALTGVTSEIAASAAYSVGAEGITMATLQGAIAEGAASIGTEIGVAGATTAAASGGISASISAALSSAAAMWPLAIVMGMYQSGKLYSAGVRPDAGEMWESGGSTALGKASMIPATLQSKAFEITDGINSKLVGGKLAAIISGSTLHQAVWGAVGKKLFGSGYETKDSGIALGVDDGEFGAQTFIQQKKKKGLISGSSKTRNIYGELDAATKDPLGAQYNEVALSAGALFKSLGFKLGEDALDGINVAWRNISTTDGSTPEWIQEQLDYFFAQVGDSAVQSINAATDAGLSGFSFASLQVFVKNLQDVNGVLKHLNVGLFDSSVQGGFMAEQLAAWAGGVEALSAAGAKYYDRFFTDVEKSSDTLADVRSGFAALGVAMPDSAQGFRDMVGGIDKTTEAGREMLLKLLGLAEAAGVGYDILESRQAAYYSAFYSEAENTARSLADITQEFKDVSITLPETRAGYRDLVEAASKDSSAAGKAMYDTLMSLAGEAGSAYDLLESKATSAAEATKALADALTDRVNAAMSALQRAVASEQKALSDAYAATTEALNTSLTAASQNVNDLTAISSSLSSALKNLRGTSESAVAMLRAQAQATLQNALLTARAGGSLVGFTGLDDAVDTVSQMDPELYASFADFSREQGRTANVLSELEGLNGKQLTSAEQAVVSLNDQLKQSKLAYDAQMKGLDDQLVIAQAQIDKLNGIDTSIISVVDAVKNLNAAILAAMASAATPAPSSFTGTAGAPSASDLNAIYNSVLGRDVDPSGAAHWAGLVGSGAITPADLPAAIRNDAILNGEIKGYAKGTNAWDGSAVLVGEHGPEIVMANNLGTNTIYPAQKSRSILNAGAQEAGGTDKDTESYREKVVKRLNEIARAVGFLDIWNSDGMPATRT